MNLRFFVDQNIRTKLNESKADMILLGYSNEKAAPTLRSPQLTFLDVSRRYAFSKAKSLAHSIHN